MGNGAMLFTTEKAHENGSNTQTITSLEVAEMVGKDHSKLLKDIRRYSGQLAEAKIGLGDFWTESTYKDANGQDRPCYHVTKMGCEYIAHKLTGVKGAAFTAKYIQRFHAMEDTIKENKEKVIGNGFSLKDVIDSLEPAANFLRMNEASRILMLENFYKGQGISIDFLPHYEHNGSRQMKALSTLLNENGCGISAVKFNQILIEQGYLEECERPSSKGGMKKYKALTEKGLKYGENAVNPHNQKEVQPLYYSDTFMGLYGIVVG